MPPLVVAQLSLVRVSDVEPTLASAVRRHVESQLGALRMCSEKMIKVSPGQGTVVVKLTVRGGRISALTVDSPVWDSRMRWCFRKQLMGLWVGHHGLTDGFDARLEFFLQSRTVRFGR